MNAANVIPVEQAEGAKTRPGLIGEPVTPEKIHIIHGVAPDMYIGVSSIAGYPSGDRGEEIIVIDVEIMGLPGKERALVAAPVAQVQMRSGLRGLIVASRLICAGQDAVLSPPHAMLDVTCGR